MNKKKRELIWHYANLIHENLCLKTDCFDKDGKLVSVKYVACIDDDPKSAVYAAWLYHKAVSEGQHPQVLCVGGLGLLSAHLKPKDVVFYSEGIRLAEVCIDLGVPIENVVILDKGRNSGENVRDIASQMIRDPGDVVFAVTKRLSLRWERTFKKQIAEQMAKQMSQKYCQKYNPEMINAPKDYYYVIDETLEEACCWMNGKRIGNCRMMFHELASIYDRCVRYAGTFQLPLEFEVSDEVKKAADYMARHYRIKNGKMGLREICQYVYLLASLKKHLPDMQKEQNNTIAEKQREFTAEFGIKF